MKPIEVFAYYFPNYHRDARNADVHGANWSEWELTRNARPRFEGHHQPNVPLWGEEDEADPNVMKKKIDAGRSHGVNGFIFDWYFYDDGPFLERALDEGFLPVADEDFRFALMWANHDWVDIHPARAGQTPSLLYPGAVTPQAFERVTDLVVEKYFRHPAYWNIDGCPYFSIYELMTLIQGLGGIENTRVALERFREKVRRAGFRDLHLNAVVWGVQILPGEQAVENPQQMLKVLGFDSVGSYVWIHHTHLPQFPQTSYSWCREQNENYWRQARAGYSVPYYPNVTMGWDSSPRCHQSDALENLGYPFMPTLQGNTPEAFEIALRSAKTFLEEQSEPKILTLNAWNEWTEGSYLEPDTRNGLAYLEAIRAVFGSRA